MFNSLTKVVKNLYKELETAFLFRHLDQGKLEQLLQQVPCQTVTYSKGQYIYDNYRFKKEIGIIIKGKIEVQKNLPTGKKIIMNKLKAGDIFGIAALFNDQICYVTSLLSSTETKILFIGEDGLLELFKLDQQLLKNYLSYVNQRIQFLNQRIECFTHEQVKDRLVEFFNQLRAQQGNTPIISLSLNKSELADYLGISRASLYRILNQLKDEGYLRAEGKKIYFNQ